jgi:hypothetical protein
MLIEFERAVPASDRVGDDMPEPSFISINPQNVSAVFTARRENGVLIIRMSDGRGFKIKSDYQEALQRLQSAPTLALPLV